MKKLITIVVLSLSLTTIVHSQTVTLQSKVDSQKGELYVGLQIEEGWHIYWKNPGDAGTATEFKFLDSDRSILPTEELWPAPQHLVSTGDLHSYSYHSNPIFKYRFNPNETPGPNAVIETNYLLCKEICIPQSKKVLIKESTPLSDEAISRSKVGYPEKGVAPSGSKFTLHHGDKPNELYLHYRLPIERALVKDQLANSNIVTPFPHPLLSFYHEKVDESESMLTGSMRIEWDGAYATPPQTLPLNDTFEKPITIKILLLANQKKTIETELSFSKIEPKVVIITDKKSPSIFIYLLFAFLGGLILNVMPCVLPVISLKLFSLIRSSHANRKRLFIHNLLYTVGVIASFLTLAVIIIIMKKSGESLGWGFQLQSPIFVLGMAIFLTGLALNLFGLFELRTIGGQKLANLTQDGPLGDLLSGVVATLLATPCSAPFLGTALAFAFTQGSATILLLFFMMAIGLSTPFILTALFPRLISILPRPGSWMITFKKVMALLLLATVAWLLFVFVALIGPKKELTGVTHFSKELLVKLQSERQVAFIDFTADWCLTCKVNEAVVLKSSDFKELLAEKKISFIVGDYTKRDPEIAEFLKLHGNSAVPAYFVVDKNGMLKFLGETITVDRIRKALE